MHALLHGHFISLEMQKDVSENVSWYALIRLHHDSSAKKQTEQLVFPSSAVLAGDEWMLY